MNSKKTLLISTFVCILPSIIGTFFYGGLPEQMPVQWGFSGEITNYAPKWFAIYGMPAFLMLFNFYCHKRADKDSTEREYPLLMIVFLKWVMPAISVICTGLSISSAKGFAMSNIGVIAFIGMIFVIIGTILSEVESNFTFGFRLPWIINNKDKLIKTHEFGGKVLIVGGIAVMNAAFLGYTLVAVILLILSIAIPILYSLKK